NQSPKVSVLSHRLPSLPLFPYTTLFRSSLSHLADLLAGLHPRARLDVDSVHVAVQGDQAMPVVQNDGVAIEEIIACCSHHTGCRCNDRCTFGCGDVHARMWCTRLVVEKTTQAEGTAAYPFNRCQHGQQ